MIFRFGTTDNELCEHPQGTGRMDRSHRRVSSWYGSAGCTASRGRVGTTPSLRSSQSSIGPRPNPGPAPHPHADLGLAPDRSPRSRAGSSPALGPCCADSRVARSQAGIAEVANFAAAVRVWHTLTSGPPLVFDAQQPAGRHCRKDRKSLSTTTYKALGRPT